MSAVNEGPPEGPEVSTSVPPPPDDDGFFPIRESSATPMSPGLDLGIPSTWKPINWQEPGGKATASSDIRRPTTLEAASGKRIERLRSLTPGIPSTPQIDREASAEAESLTNLKWATRNMFLSTSSELYHKARKGKNQARFIRARFSRGIESLQEIATEELCAAVMANHEIQDDSEFASLVREVSSVEPDIRGQILNQNVIDALNQSGGDEVMDAALEGAGIHSEPIPRVRIPTEEPPEVLMNASADWFYKRQLNYVTDLLEQSLNREKFLIGRSILMEQKMANINLETHQQFTNALAHNELCFRTINQQILDSSAGLMNDIRMELNEVRLDIERVEAKDSYHHMEGTVDEPIILDGGDSETVKQTMTGIFDLVKDLKESLKVMNSKIDGVTRRVDQIQKAPTPDPQIIHAPQASRPISIPTPQPRPKSVSFRPDTVFERESPRVSELEYAGRTEFDVYDNEEEERLDWSADTPPRVQTPPAPPLHPETRPRSKSPNLLKGAEYFLALADTERDDRILWWTKVIGWGNWGAPNADGKAEKMAGSATTAEKREYIKRAIYHAFAPNSYGAFLLPPTKSVGQRRAQSELSYGWENAEYKGYGMLPPNVNTPSRWCEPPGPFYEDYFPEVTN